MHLVVDSLGCHIVVPPRHSTLQCHERRPAPNNMSTWSAAIHCTLVVPGTLTVGCAGLWFRSRRSHRECTTDVQTAGSAKLDRACLKSGARTCPGVVGGPEIEASSERGTRFPHSCGLDACSSNHNDARNRDQLTRRHQFSRRLLKDEISTPILERRLASILGMIAIHLASLPNPLVTGNLFGDAARIAE